MKSKKDISISFTGHRSYQGEADVQLHHTLRQLYNDGYTRFLCGMAWGWDLAAAEAVIELRKEYGEITLIAVEPYAEFRRLFHGKDLEQYNRVVESADEVVVVSEQGGDAAFRMRNDYLIENAAIVVAWFDGQPRGGTAYTVRRARHSSVPVINLMFNPQLSLEF